MMNLRIAAVAGVLLLGSCGGGGGGGTTPPPTTTILQPDALSVNTTRVFASVSLDQALDMVEFGGRWYVAERPGRIVSFPTGGGASRVSLDITDRVVADDAENGLMAIEFHPEADANGAMYVSYTADVPLDSRLSYFAFDPATGIIDPSSEQILLTVRQPDSNHNGGDLLFEPGTMNLYWGQGDGGGAGDPTNSGQNTNNLLGTILRIDLTTPNAVVIPADNPFADGVDGKPEIYAHGLRNPWRFDQDPVGGNFYAGDVGQDAVEEINLIEAGANYGWNCFEGSTSFSGNANCPDRSTTQLPIVSFTRGTAESITGGKAYRGSAIAGLAGRFVFADFITGNIWAVEETQTGFTTELIAQTDLNIVTFGADSAGELYVLSYFTGEIHKIVP